MHVSEVSWDLVQDVRDILTEGDEVRVKVTSVDRLVQNHINKVLIMPNPHVVMQIINFVANSVIPSTYSLFQLTI